MKKEKTFEPPEQNFITIGAEHFRCAEVLLLSDFAQHLLLHNYRREEDRSECCKENCVTSFWIIRHSSNPLSGRRPAISQTKTSSLSLLTVSVAWKYGTSQVSLVKKPTGFHDTFFQNIVSVTFTSAKSGTPMSCAWPFSKVLLST